MLSEAEIAQLDGFIVPDAFATRALQDGDAERAFQSGVKREASPGAGLGLSIVKDLSGTYDIPVDVWSEPGAGTCFSIWLRPA